MTERWFKALNNNQIVVVLLVDYEKAFDNVSHTILIMKLSAWGNWRSTLLLEKLPYFKETVYEIEQCSL